MPSQYGGGDFRAAFRRLGETARNVGRFRELVKFLIALFFFYSGIRVVITFAAIYAQKELGFTPADTVLLVIVVNVTASAGAFLLMAGTHGKRAALPNSRIMIHQPLGGTQGQVSDMVIMTEEAQRTKKKINELLVHHTGQPLERVEKDTDRNNFMSPEQAKEYGLIDKIYSSGRTLKS